MANYGSLAYLAYPNTDPDALKTPLTSLPSEVRPLIARRQRGSNHRPSDQKSSSTIPVARRRTWGWELDPDTSRYLDDIFTIDNPEFEKHVPNIYPAELQWNKANTSDKETSFLDLNIKVIGSDVHTSVY